VAALHRAVALEQIHQLPWVSPNTWISMWRGRVRYFSTSTWSCRSWRRLALARGQRVEEVGALLDQAHALAAAARRGLDEHRVADGVGLHVEEAGSWWSPW
jgi:hypothetical protein